MTATRMASQKTPVVIIGSGIAGLLTALKLAEWKIHCTVVSKTKLSENSSHMAQGGIAAVLPTNPDDSLLLHLKDTLDAGAGLSNRVVAKSILNDGADAISDLLTLGVPFDTDTQSGAIALGLEGAHSTRRILHAGGDSTGATVQETLTKRVLESPYISVLEQCFVKNLLTDPDTKECIGVIGVQRTSKGTGSAFSPYLKWLAIEAEHVVLATGGVGRLYSHTTNPAVSTGDGVALAYRAGADIQDVEFIQFHPTAFWGPKGAEFLISEALRGEGGILRDANGEAFAKTYHPLGELAPRDILTRMIVDTLQKQNTTHVFLDMTHLDPAMLETRFPSILKLCLKFDVDLRKDWIPVAPAAHYWMGGVKVDSHGQSTIPRLYAVGEVACTGLHGANRLASNSLLECLVLARRVAKAIRKQKSTATHIPNRFNTLLEAATEHYAERLAPSGHSLNVPIQQLRQLMWTHVGIARTQDGLEMALRTLTHLENYGRQEGFFDSFPAGFEYENMVLTARLIAGCALARQESRGAHYRQDFPNTTRKALHSLCDPEQDSLLNPAKGAILS